MAMQRKLLRRLGGLGRGANPRIPQTVRRSSGGRAAPHPGANARATGKAVAAQPTVSRSSGARRPHRGFSPEARSGARRASIGRSSPGTPIRPRSTGSAQGTLFDAPAGASRGTPIRPRSPSTGKQMEMDLNSLPPKASDLIEAGAAPGTRGKMKWGTKAAIGGAAGIGGLMYVNRDRGGSQSLYR